MLNNLTEFFFLDVYLFNFFDESPSLLSYLFFIWETHFLYLINYVIYIFLDYFSVFSISALKSTDLLIFFLEKGFNNFLLKFSQQMSA
jgi:hypothetical protein